MGPDELAGVAVQGSGVFSEKLFPSKRRHWEHSEFSGALAA